MAQAAARVEVAKMVTVHGVLTSMLNMLAGLVPVGVQPVHFWLTLLVSFAITYVILLLLPIFRDHRGAGFIVAAVISYFVASSAFATVVIAKLFPNVGIALMAILGLLMVIAILSPNSIKSGSTRATPIIVIIAIIFVIWATYSSVASEFQVGTGGGGVGVTNSDVATIIAILIIIGIIAIIVSPSKSGGSRSDRIGKFFDWLGGSGW